MSFWSSLMLARAAPPPVVTVAAIGAFIRDLAATGALVGGAELLCQIKYGPRVDADEQTTDLVEWDDSGIIGTHGEYPWDRSDTFASPVALADALAADSGTVYRAYLSLGELHPEIIAALTREPSEENEVGLCLWAIRLDNDNMVKPIMDALNGLIYLDDKQITDTVVRKTDIDGAFVVRGASMILLEAFSAGKEFLHIQIEPAPSHARFLE